MFFTICISESVWGSQARKVLLNPHVSRRQCQRFVLRLLNKVLVAVLMIWREEKSAKCLSESASGAVCAASSCKPLLSAAQCMRRKELRHGLSFSGFCSMTGLSECGCADAPVLLMLSCFSLCRCVVVARGIFSSAVAVAFVGDVSPGLPLHPGLVRFGVTMVKEIENGCLAGREGARTSLQSHGDSHQHSLLL